MHKIKWLRISYWTAAIADFLIAILVLTPKLVGINSYVYPIGMVSVISISWGILLILANKNPIAHRWVLIPTMIVVALLGLVTIHALSFNLAPMGLLISGIILSILLFSLLLFSYLNSKHIEPKIV